MCKRIVDFGHCEDPNCSFAHSVEELRATSKFYKTTLCKFHAVRECRHGAFCRHAHGKEDLREEVRHQDVEEAAQAYNHDLSSGGLCLTRTSSAPSAPAVPSRHYVGGMNSFSGCAPSEEQPAGYIGASAVAPPMPPPTHLALLREEHHSMDDFVGADMPAITPGLTFASSGSTCVEPYLVGQFSDGDGRQRISQDEVFLFDQPGMMVFRL